jgi:hypothetical protein
MTKIIYFLTDIGEMPENFKTLAQAKRAYLKNPDNYLDDLCVKYDEEAMDADDYISIKNL